MKISTTNHPNKEYGCGLGKAKLNVYNGKLGFEYPLLSIGANNFQISTTIIYNSQYKNFELGSKKIGFGNGWKLNIQQYLIPYSSTYSLAGFNEGNYIYIDSNWNIHKFVKYKDESDYYDGENLYYDEYGSDKILIINSKNEKIVQDIYKNEYWFNENGDISKIVSGVNKQIIKEIIYNNANIIAIYDSRKKSNKINFIYNELGFITQIYSTISSVRYSFNYNDKNLYNIIKENNKRTKKVVEFIYDEDKLNFIINSADLTTLNFEYGIMNNLFVVEKIKSGVMKKNYILKNDSSTLSLGEDYFLNEKIYLNNSGMKLENYNLTLPKKYIKEEVLFTYNKSWTQETNNKGINIRYYFDVNGKQISSLEFKNNNLFTLSREKGWKLSSNGMGENKFNGELINLLNSSNSYTYVVNDELINNFKSIFDIQKYPNDINNLETKEKYSEHFNISFWINFINGNSDTAIINLNYELSGESKVTKFKIRETDIGAWQHVIIPINLGTDQKSLKNLSVQVDGCSNSTEIQFSNLIISKGGVQEIYIFNGKGEFYDEEKFTFDSKLLVDNIEKSQTKYFYLTESDVFKTFKSKLYYAKNNKNYFELHYNSGTKIDIVKDIKLIKENKDGSNKLLEFCIDDIISNNQYIPMYYTKLVDLIKEGTWTITEKQVSFHLNNVKNYIETKTMMGTINDVDSITKRLADNKSYINYNWQNEDGTFRAKKDTNKIITENFYDEYGNIIKSKIYKEMTDDDSESENDEIIVVYNYNESPLLRENYSSFEADGVKNIVSYDNENLILMSRKGSEKKNFTYNEYKEQISEVVFSDTISENVIAKNDLDYYKNGSLKTVKSEDGIVYGFRYNIYNELSKVYRNKKLLYEKEYIKNGSEEKEIKKVYQLRNNPIISEVKYDIYGNISQCTNENLKVNFLYEDYFDKESGIISRPVKIEDEFAGEVYEYSYIDNEDITSETIKINGKLEKINYSDDTTEYKLKDDKWIKFENINDNALNENIVETNYYFKNDGDEQFTNKFDEFSYKYIYDECNRLKHKTGTKIVYDTCNVCDSCDHENSIQIDKEINYKKNTTVPNKLTYNVNAKMIENEIHQTNLIYENEHYDDFGNVTSVKEHGYRFLKSPINVDNSDMVPLPDRHYKFNYDKFNRIESEENPDFGNLLYEYGQKTGMLEKIYKNNDLITEFVYSAGYLTKIIEDDKIHSINYDNFGNILNNKTSNFTYNSRNLMSSLVTSKNYSGDIVNIKCDYFYNYKGIRYKKKILKDLNNRFPIVTNINYYLDGDVILGEDWTDANNNITDKLRYFYDAEGISGISYNDCNYNLLRDSLGNISKIMCGGKLVGEYLYDAWGNFVVKELSVDNDNDRFVLFNNPFRYKGYYCDLESELYYCKTRYYDSKMHIWLSPDDIQFLDCEDKIGVNLYCYCKNNPVMLVDENGNMPKWLSITLKCVAAAAIVALCVVTCGGTAVAIGVGVSVAATFTCDLIDDGKINSGVDAYLGAVVGGAIGALGGGFASTMLSSGIGNGVQGIFDGSVTSGSDFVTQFMVGVVTSGITYGLSKGISKLAAAKKLDKLVGNWNKSNSKINKILKDIDLGNVKIGRDGIEGVFEEFYEKKNYKLLGEITSNVWDFVVGLFN